MKRIFFKTLLAFAAFCVIFSCDKDINDVGSDIIGKDNFDFKLFEESSVIAYNHKTGEVQSNNLPINQLGIYEDPFFGTTTASFVTQILLETINPNLNNKTVTDVKLEIPYFSTKTTTDNIDNYAFNAIYGNKTNKINLSIYRNGVPLEKVVAGGVPKIYFSNKDFDAAKIGSKLNDGEASQNTEFIFNETAISTTSTAGVVTKSQPAMVLKLNNIIGTDILDTAANLSSNGQFTQFYKGLFFKVEQSGSNKGCLSLLDFNKGKITISYGAEGANKLVLNLTGGISVNLLNHLGQSVYQNAITNPNKITGDDNLYLKGGDGSIAVIELFKEDKHGLNGLGGPNGVSDIIDLKNSGWIINEANLTFNIDKNKFSNNDNQVADRIFLYDFYNKREILDYINDNSVSTSSIPAKNVFGGTIIKNSNNSYIKYKIRLTNHIKNLIEKDSTNVKLGLCVTQNIANNLFGKTNSNPFNQLDFSNVDDTIKYFNNSFYLPFGSILNPLGTVLYGSTQNIDASKRLKLQIYYTKPNN